MTYLKLLLTLLFIIFFIVVFVYFANLYVDNNYPDRKLTLIHAPEIEKLKIKKVGIVNSYTRATSLPFNSRSSINRHTDVIFKAEDDSYYGLLTVYDRNQINSKKCILKPLLIMFDEKYEVFVEGYIYKLVELYDISSNWTIGEVYDIIEEQMRLPYHYLKNNCHHVSRIIVDILTDKNTLRDVMSNKNCKYFEFSDSSFLPFIYVKEYIIDAIIGNKNIKFDL